MAWVGRDLQDWIKATPILGHSCIFSVLGALGLNGILQVEPHEDRASEGTHFPLPAGHPSIEAVQNTVGH